MKVILTIGHTSILLPDDKGLSTIIRALSRGLECSDWLFNNKVIVKDQVEISFKTVPAKTRIVTGEGAEEAEMLALYDTRKGDA